MRDLDEDIKKFEEMKEVVEKCPCVRNGQVMENIPEEQIIISKTFVSSILQIVIGSMKLKKKQIEKKSEQEPLKSKIKRWLHKYEDEDKEEYKDVIKQAGGCSSEAG